MSSDLFWLVATVQVALSIGLDPLCVAGAVVLDVGCSCRPRGA